MLTILKTTDLKEVSREACLRAAPIFRASVDLAAVAPGGSLWDEAVPVGKSLSPSGCGKEQRREGPSASQQPGTTAGEHVLPGGRATTADSGSEIVSHISKQDSVTSGPEFLLPRHQYLSKDSPDDAQLNVCLLHANALIPCYQKFLLPSKYSPCCFYRQSHKPKQSSKGSTPPPPLLPTPVSFLSKH